jgi:hypothetical protein
MRPAYWANRDGIINLRSEHQGDEHNENSYEEGTGTAFPKPRGHEDNDDESGIPPPFVLLLLFGEFLKMCPISGKTTKIPLNMRLMDTARPSRMKVKRLVLHTCLQQPPQAG